MRFAPPILFWPGSDPVCCKASAACRTRAAWTVEIVRGDRVERKPYCGEHMDKLINRQGDRVRLVDPPKE